MTKFKVFVTEAKLPGILPFVRLTFIHQEETQSFKLRVILAYSRFRNIG